MKKRAFTMVELIFVIVILGILAAVAVPKLNASRADAQTSKLKANLVTLAKDFENYYAANGEFCTPASGNNDCYVKITDITSVPFDKIDSNLGYIKKDGKDCLYAYAGCFGDTKSQIWGIRVFADCLTELQKPQYYDVQWLFTGYAGWDSAKNPPYSDPKNIVKDANGGWARHLMNDPDKGVQFE